MMRFRKPILQPKKRTIERRLRFGVKFLAKEGCLTLWNWSFIYQKRCILIALIVKCCKEFLGF